MPRRLDPDLVRRFRTYGWKASCWGSLHIAMDDGNLEPQHIEFCRSAALADGDAEGEALAFALLEMTRSQRQRIYRVANRYEP